MQTRHHELRGAGCLVAGSTLASAFAEWRHPRALTSSMWLPPAMSNATDVFASQLHDAFHA